MAARIFLLNRRAIPAQSVCAELTVSSSELDFLSTKKVSGTFGYALVKKVTPFFVRFDHGIVTRF